MREYRALVDAGSDFCLLPKVDAFRLGYPEAANDDLIVRSYNTMFFSTHSGYGQAASIRMAKVEIGRQSFENVEFLAFDLPQVTGFDVVLGGSLLKFLTLRIDYPSGRLEIAKVG
ncbi:MAG: retropepsin-like domain-containing protein [Nitrososphaerota archaeon]|nr:retropepsin-like domain-containing protein [Nitrososphaerota archaeon]MDG7023297.1 retropepsin-like domain-containing protein [Nitrososphaerota archaeon]